MTDMRLDITVGSFRRRRTIIAVSHWFGLRAYTRQGRVCLQAQKATNSILECNQLHLTWGFSIKQSVRNWKLPVFGDWSDAWGDLFFGCCRKVRGGLVSNMLASQLCLACSTSSNTSATPIRLFIWFDPMPQQFQHRLHTCNTHTTSYNARSTYKPAGPETVLVKIEFYKKMVFCLSEATIVVTWKVGNLDVQIWVFFGQMVFSPQ